MSESFFLLLMRDRQFVSSCRIPHFPRETNTHTPLFLLLLSEECYYLCVSLHLSQSVVFLRLNIVDMFHPALCSVCVYVCEPEVSALLFCRAGQGGSILNTLSYR